MAANIHEEEELGKPIDSTLLKRLLVFVKPYKKFVFLAVILTISISGLAAIRPAFTQMAVDDYITKGNIPGLQFIVLLFIGSLILQGLIQYGMTYLTSWIGQNVTFDLRKKIFDHITRLNLKYFDNNPIGRLVTRVTSDVEVLFEVFSSGIVTAFGDIFLIIGIVAFMFALDVELTLVTLAVLPLLIYATSVFRRKVRDSFRKIRLLIARLNSFIQEHLSGVSIVQYFNKEKQTISDFEEINREHTNQNIRSVFYYAVFFPIVELIGAVAMALIIWYGGGQVVQGAVSVGVVIAFLQYTEMFFRPIRDLSEKYNILQQAMASSERIFEVLDYESPIKDPKEPVKIEDVKGDINFNNVSFGYNPDEYVIRNINFDIKAGEKVAFVGATGAGKSTIINLLCRFYDVNEGEILLDGVDLRKMKLHDLRENIAIVLQDVFLFRGDIKSNINLGKGSITDEKINEAVKNVGLQNFINSLPHKLDTEVLERGSSFSTGQKQLISFARALAYDPKILILDEATSSVDTHTEILIQEAIKKLIEGRTSIIIAHRLSTIQKCDKIIVMHKGEIKEMGTHQELLEKGGLYYKLYQLQYKEEMTFDE
jgi:ATP-binding cassette, subfamily B, multidrug efflux pump